MDVADFKHVKRVLLTSDTIDCEAFGGCEIYRVKFPVGQSAHTDLLAQSDNQADPLGVIIRAAGWESRTNSLEQMERECEAPAELVSSRSISAPDVLCDNESDQQAGIMPQSLARQEPRTPENAPPDLRPLASPVIASLRIDSVPQLLIPRPLSM